MGICISTPARLRLLALVLGPGVADALRPSPAMDPNLPLPDPLSHLQPCPECPTGKVTVPLLCSGIINPDHFNRWYEVVSISQLYMSSICQSLRLRCDLFSALGTSKCPPAAMAANTSAGEATFPRANPQQAVLRKSVQARFASNDLLGAA